jgi:hypothetical protein
MCPLIFRFPAFSPPKTGFEADRHFFRSFFPWFHFFCINIFGTHKKTWVFLIVSILQIRPRRFKEVFLAIFRTFFNSATVFHVLKEVFAPPF